MVMLAADDVPTHASWERLRGLLLPFVVFVLACPAHDLGKRNGLALADSAVGTANIDGTTGGLGGQPTDTLVACRGGHPSCPGGQSAILRSVSDLGGAAGATTQAGFDHSGSETTSNGDDAVGGTASAVARRTLATYPSSVVNGSASATFPASAFGAWCAANAACAAAGSLSLALLHYTDPSPFTSTTLNWPNVFSGTGISALRLVSGVVELQLGGYAAKLDKLICDSSTPCVAQLSIPLTSPDVSQSFACLRLEPSVTGGGYQAYGFPPGADGTSVDGTIINGLMRCNTNRFGKHIIMQYKQSVLSPPPPPVRPPPPSPPPPPPLNTSGAKFETDVKLLMTLRLSVGFDTLKANSTLLSALTTSLESTLTSSLATVVPELLLLSSATNSTGSIYKISRLSSSSTDAVSMEVRLVVPAGVTEGQVLALMQLVTTNTTVMFTGSPYTTYFMGQADVAYVPSAPEDTISTSEAVGIAMGAMFGTLLLIAACYALYRWRAYRALVPKRPTGEWDKTGVALVPRNHGRRRKNTDASPDSPDAVSEGQQQQQQRRAGGSATEGKGGARAVAPWEGASGPAGGGGGGGGGVKSEAELLPSKEAWG